MNGTGKLNSRLDEYEAIFTGGTFRVGDQLVATEKNYLALEIIQMLRKAIEQRNKYIMNSRAIARLDKEIFDIGGPNDSEE